MRRVVYDLTIFEEDGVTPMFGDAYYGDLVESDFQTPDVELEHERPYLMVPENAIATEMDPVEGSSRIGSVQVRVLDKRTVTDNQRTGILTSRIGDVVGKRALLRRWIEDPPGVQYGGWQIVMDGVVASHAPDDVVYYRLEIRDGREFERNSRLFFSNHVLFGKDGLSGPAIDYCRKPGGGFMVPAVEPIRSFDGSGEPFGPNHFELIAGGVPGGVNFGIVALPRVLSVGLGGLGWPVQNAAGRWEYQDVQMAWRPQGSTGSYTVLRNMPALFYGFLVNSPNTLLESLNFARTFPTLYFGSTDPDKLPTNGQPIEFLILAVEITEETPFYWDGGTHGDLLREIVAGDHTLIIPQERYSAAALVDFARTSPPCRFVLKSPVTNRREWHEENIYKPSLVAPALNEQMEIVPTSWLLPNADEATPILDVETIQAPGDFDHGTDNAVGTIEFFYFREHLDPLKQITQTRTKGHWFWKKKIDELVNDPEDVRSLWERLVETEVKISRTDPNAVPGAGTKTYKPIGVRSIGGVDGSPAGGDAQDELGNQIAEHIFATLFPRFRRGAAKFVAEITATPANLTRRMGDWCRARVQWLPSYPDALRGLREYMQIIAITDPTPNMRRVTLISGNVPDLSADDDEFGTGDGTGTDCLGVSGGTPYPAGDGKTIRLFSEVGRFFLTNSCDEPIEVELLIVGGGGGGGGGANGAGGGGGAGGAIGADIEDPVVVTVAPGASIPIDVGAGGGYGDPNGDGGEDSIVWVDAGTGEALDPDVDPIPGAFRAKGGGRGSSDSPGSGGSGGGGGGTLPISGGGVTPGAGGTLGQGNAGGHGEDIGGIATCRGSAGGGGGSYIQSGSDGSADTDAGSQPGIGGGGYRIPQWGVTLGGGGGGGAFDSPAALGDLCAAQQAPGFPGDPGAGAGGAGGGGSAAGSGGVRGVVAVRYTGKRLANLPTPGVTSVTPTDSNQATVCVEGNEWPVGAVEGIRVRVEYATGDLEPDPDSGEWRLAGYLDEPGCVTTPPVPTGAIVYGRSSAEAPGYKPSPKGTTLDGSTPGTPGLLDMDVTIDVSGNATVTWTPNAFCAAVKLRALVHAAGADTSRPLSLLVSLDASLGTYAIASMVPKGFYATVDVEAWEDDTYVVMGRTSRVSQLRPDSTIPRPSDGLSFFDDVLITNPQYDDILQYKDSGKFENRRKPRLDQWAEAHDNTNLNASLAQHGLLRKLNGNVGDYLGGDGDWHEAVTEWTEVVAAADQDVTNNGTLQNDAELLFPMVAGGVYVVELLMVYSGNNVTGGFKYDFIWPGGLIGFWGFSQKGSGGGAQFFAPSQSVTSGQGSSNDMGVTVSLTDKHFSRMYYEASPSSSGNFQMRFCNVNPAGGRTSRRLAGSVLRYRRVV